MYLRRVEFEPHKEKRPFNILPGTAIDEEQAQGAATELRQSLIGEGYRDASVEASLHPAGVEQADLRFRVTRGRQYRIRQIVLSGELGLPASEVKHALQLQGAPYADAEIGAGLARLRSFYISRGYFDARAQRGKATFAADKVGLSLTVNAGRHYQVRGGEFPARDVCACLAESRRDAENGGALEFSARMELDSAGAGGAEYRLTSAAGPTYTVGHIDFRGNHVLRDSTLRRALVLDEGAVFDGSRLRRSLERLSRLSLIEPVTAADLQIAPDPATGRADLTISVHERPRGRWSLSGPAIPIGLAGPFQASIMSRLPAWGHGIFEGSTWFGLFALTGLPPWLARVLPFTSGKRLLPVFGFGRPYLPGQAWTSGFFYAPALGWQSAGTSFGAFRVQQVLRAVLHLDSPVPPALAVPVFWSEPGHSEDAALLCDSQKPGKLRAIGRTAAGFLLGSQ